MHSKQPQHKLNRNNQTRAYKSFHMQILYTEWTNTFTNKPTDRSLIIHMHWLRDNHTEVQRYTHTHTHTHTEWRTHTHTHTHTQWHTHTHTHTRTLAYTPTPTHSGKHTHTHTCTHTHTHTHTVVHTHTYTHTHKRMHTHACTHTLTDTHTHTQSSLCQHLPSIFAKRFHKGSKTSGSFAQSDEKRKRVPSSWTKIILIIIILRKKN